MNRVKYAVIILLLSIGFCALSIYHLTQVHDEMLDDLTRIEQAAELEDTPLIHDLCLDLESKWQEGEYLLLSHIHHDRVEEITTSVARLPALAKYEHYGELLAEVNLIRSNVEHLWESEVPNMWGFGE